MSKSSHKPTKSPVDELHRIRLPGFLIDEEIGLGDVIKRVTARMGIRPCGGCRRRAAALNRRVVFTGRHG